MPTTLSFIIPTLNEAVRLPALLRALQSQTRRPDEVIVADAGYKDGTVELAQGFGAIVVPGGKPGPGRNAGARVATGDLLLFLDADVIPAPDFLVTVPAETNASGPEQPPMQTYLTQKGTQIQTDVHFICFGLQLNTQYLQPQLGNTLDERNQVKVNRHLQVAGYEHIFAVGDIANTREPKRIHPASAHAKIVAVNIARLAAGDQNLVDYQPTSAATIAIPLGTTGGAVQLPVGKQGIVLGAWAASRVKGKSLLTERQWKALGAEPDKDTLVADLEIPLPAIPAQDN